VVLDGVYRRNADGAPVFVEVPAPTDEALHAVLHKIITRMMKLLTRRGLIEEQGQTYMADYDGDSDEACVLRPLQATACTYRIAFGPRLGQKVLTVHGAMLMETNFNQTLCADIDGFSLRAAVRCGADDRQAMEQLCRYIIRPALSGERVQRKAAGQVAPRLKTAWRDGTTHLSLSPLEFVQRLPALVPRRPHHLRLTASGLPMSAIRSPVWVDFNRSHSRSERPSADIETRPPGSSRSATHSAGQALSPATGTLSHGNLDKPIL